MERKHPLAECWKCPLIEAKCAPTSGPKDATVAFVSRSPGRHDVRGGKPFAGQSGKVLDHLLRRYKKNRGEILTTNVVLCRTDEPTPDAIKACRPRLEHELANVDLIVAGGTEAIAALTKYRTVSKARGFSTKRVSPVSGKEQRVVATNNPAMVIRDSDSYPNMVDDFRRAFDPPPPPKFPEVSVITDASRARDILRGWQTARHNIVSSDLEWTGTQIECAGFSKDGIKAVVFTRGALESRSVWPLFKSYYERSDVKFVWHNGKSDTTILRHNDIGARVDEDTFLQSYALDERPGYHDLEYLLSSELGWPDYEPQSVKNFKRTGVLVTPYELYRYNGWDSAGTMQLFNRQTPRLREDNVEELYKLRLLPAANAIREVEMRGFYFDAEKACDIRESEVLPKLWSFETRLRELSERELLNPRSVPQMRAVYYSQFGLNHALRDTGKKKLGVSTGAEVRKEIEDGRFGCKPRHRETVVSFAHVHQRFAKLDKLRSSFIEALAKQAVNGEKVHTTFNIAGTVTGRLSSKEPNLQNVVREGVEDIPSIRTLFLPSPGNVIISADYSQAELRTCAKLSGDSNLLAIYRDSTRSLHKERAAAFYGEDYTKEEYVKSKNINFGVTYGQSAKAFAQMYHMPEREAQDYINTWWNEFPALKEWTRETASMALRDGFVQSPFGHKRRFHLITDENIGELQREAVNFLPQNIAAWLTMCSIIRFVAIGFPVVASVHDSIVADVPESEALSVANTMRQIMIETPIKELGWDDIPFEVDVAIGRSWGEVVAA